MAMTMSATTIGQVISNGRVNVRRRLIGILDAGRRAAPLTLVYDGSGSLESFRRPGLRHYCGRRSTRRRSWALSATTIVDADMRMAPTAGDRVIPAHARTPAASGMATTL